MLITSKVIDLESLCSSDCPDKVKELFLIAMVLRDKVFVEEIRVSVTIEDVNDNDPYFRVSTYQKSIKEVIYGPGKYIELPRAQDKDISRINKAMSYRLKDNSTLFELSVSKEGQPRIKVLMDLDAEEESSHNLVLIAWNTFDANRLSATLQVTIFIEDINDNEPRFTQAIYKVPIPENVELNHTIFQLKATDRDKTSRLQYLIMPEVSDLIKKTFIVSNNGLISLILRLDYETKRQYSIPVGVTDGEFSSNARVEVIIIDINDCPPQFSLNPANLIVPENVRVSLVLGQMTVYDRDSSYVDKGVECKDFLGNQTMKFEMVDYNNWRQLKINVILQQKLDRDRLGGDIMSSVLVCNDMGLNERLTSSFTILLTVTDRNDNAPDFLMKEYVVRIKENMRPQYPLTQVSATDNDAGLNSQINYYIPNLDFHELFRVDRDTGEITVLQSLDRENKDYYQIIVMATDLSINETRLTSSTTIHVHVLDVNDCVPRINGSFTSFTIAENEPIGTVIGALEASDCDIGLNGQFVFTLIPSAYSHYFDLNTNGTMLSKLSFDREKLSQARFCLRVTVRDLGEENYLSSKTVVCISVLDKNDNAPQISIIPDFIPAQNHTVNHTFDFSSLVSMTEPIGSSILSFSCSDLDEGENSHIDVNLEVLSQTKAATSLFKLNTSQKAVKLNRQWQKEDGNKFILTLTAKDNGKIPLQSTKVILIVFADIPPRFFDHTIPLASLSNTKINILIIVVLVTISSLLTAALVGAIICMIKPCGRKLFGCTGDLVQSCDSNNHRTRTKSFPHTYLMPSDMMGSISNEGSELKADVNSQSNDYRLSEHHWTHRREDVGRTLKPFTLQPQLLPGSMTTTQEEQRSDSGRGASDEDNPTYLSNTDFFQNKPHYSIVPNVRYTSFADVLNSTKPLSYSSTASDIPISFMSSGLPISCITNENLFTNMLSSSGECEDSCKFIHSASVPFYSNPYHQNLKILQAPTTPHISPEMNIPLLSFEPYPLSLAQTSTSPSSNDDNSEKCSHILSQIVTVDDDTANLSSHIDQLFFTTRPMRLKSLSKT